jgi:hypothetical protein
LKPEHVVLNIKVHTFGEDVIVELEVETHHTKK